ncbi:LysR family transcriptional regulator [Undibacterium jejuense]|nr:LysR family transcriptional regulator [Undibacterium jejuense]
MKLFMHIAEAGNMTRGAEKMHISVSAASLRLKNLEEALGVPLFERLAKGVELTAAGENFLSHVRKIHSNLERMHADLNEFSLGVKGSLRIYANTNSINSYLPESLSTFLANNPSINIDLQEHNSNTIALAVMEGVADIGIMAGNIPTMGLEFLPFRTDRLILVVPKNSKFADELSIPFSTALTHNFVCLDVDSAIQIFLQQMATQMGQRLKVRIHVRSFDAICRMVAAGVGIGVVPHSAAEEHIQAGKLSGIELADDWAMREMKICFLNFNKLSSYGQQLVQFLSSGYCGIK